MQESRLFQIVYYLLERGRATAPELAEKFEVSVRTIYRDIDALSGAGIPVYTETGRGGGIRLMSGYVLERAVLSDEEKLDVLTALQSAITMQGIPESGILSKLAALWGTRAEDWLEVDFSRWGNKQRDNAKFEAFKSAILGRQCVRITYAGSRQAISERVIQPFQLVYKSRDWYVSAYCTKRQEDRLFKLNRITDWDLLDTHFSRRPCKALRQEAEQTYDRVALRFPEEMAYRVYDEFDPAEVVRQENGDFVVSAYLPKDAWLIGYLLSFGTQVEVVEPAELRSALAEQAKAIYEAHRAEREK